MSCCLFADAAPVPLVFGGFVAVAVLFFAIALAWAGIKLAWRSAHANRRADEPPVDGPPDKAP
jgi:hypothetical protein